MSPEFISSSDQSLHEGQALSSVEESLVGKILVADTLTSLEQRRISDLMVKAKYLGKPIDSLIESENPLARAVGMQMYNSSDMPEEYRRELNISLRSDLNVKPELNKPGWTLCSSSEGRMIAAIGESATMKLGGLMIKLKGRITALCYESFVTPSGTFIEGNFYSPDRATQANLKEQFLEGATTPELPESTWYLIRRVEKGEHMFEKVRYQANNMPDELPNYWIGYAPSRAVYLEKGKEEYLGGQ